VTVASAHATFRSTLPPPPLRTKELPNIDVEAVDRVLLLPNGRIRLMPEQELLALGLPTLQAWAGLRARYQLVTQELVDWLRLRIGSRPAIEIGAGMGDLGFHLGIPMTDLGVQAEDPGYWRSLGQAPTEPPEDVERLEAEAAIARFKPAVVVGAWISERHHVGSCGGFGVEEARIVRSVPQYIHVGNLAVHGSKRVLRMKHRVYRPAGLVSRGFEPAKNTVHVWGDAPAMEKPSRPNGV